MSLEPLGTSQLVQLGLIGGAILASLKLLAASRGDVSTALALLSYGGYLRPLLTVVVSFVPTFLVYVLVGIQIYRAAYKEAKLEFKHTMPVFYFGLFLALLGLFALDGVGYLFLLGIYVGYNVVENRLVHKRERKSGTPVTPQQYVAIKRHDTLTQYTTLIILGLMTTLTQGFTDLYGPREQIVTQNGTYYGSVVGNKDDWTAILTDQRRIVFSRPDDLVTRNICREIRFQPLFYWISGEFTTQTSDLKCPTAPS